MLRVGYIQSSPQFGLPRQNREALLEQARTLDADLLVLPELCHSGYVFSSAGEARALSEPIPDGPTSRALLAYARERRTTLIAGICEQQGEQLYNAAAVFGPDGHLGTYRKIHLFKEEKLWFTPGDTPLRVYEIGGARVGLMICFDWRFPEVARSLALLGADVIAHPANLVLPYCQEVMRARCIENRVFSVTANRVGDDTRPDGRRETFTGASQIVDPDGALLSRAPVDREATAVVSIDISAARRKGINEHNDLLADRRPEFYQPLAAADSTTRPAG